MHHSADPSAEAVHHQRRDRCDFGNRTSETKPKCFPEKKLMNITWFSLVSFAGWVTQNVEGEISFHPVLTCWAVTHDLNHWSKALHHKIFLKESYCISQISSQTQSRPHFPPSSPVFSISFYFNDSTVYWNFSNDSWLFWRTIFQARQCSVCHHCCRLSGSV